jgi:hypothetical protein
MTSCYGGFLVANSLYRRDAALESPCRLGEVSALFIAAFRRFEAGLILAPTPPYRLTPRPGATPSTSAPLLTTGTPFTST